MTLDKNPEIKETQIPERINPYPTGSILTVREYFYGYLSLEIEELREILMNSTRVSPLGVITNSWTFKKSCTKQKKFKIGECVFLLKSFRLQKCLHMGSTATNVWIFLYEGMKYTLVMPAYVTQQELFKHT